MATSVQQVETQTSLAAAKPKHTENYARSKVSIFFTPLEIVLCSNGIDSSQTVPSTEGELPTTREVCQLFNIWNRFDAYQVTSGGRCVD